MDPAPVATTDDRLERQADESELRDLIQRYAPALRRLRTNTGRR